MANEQTSVPLFAASEVLTAANMNISAGTGVPVFSNSTTRDAGFGGANEKVLAEGQLCYLSSTNVVQYYDGAAWATVGPAAPGALTLISATTIGTTVSSVTVSSAFSATYDAYKIIVSGGVGSTNSTWQMTLGASTANYYYSMAYTSYNNTVAGFGSSTGSNWDNVGGILSGSALNLNMELINPFAAKKTSFSAANVKSDIAGMISGYHNDATSYTAFTLTVASGTVTGGTVRVYGYANS